MSDQSASITAVATALDEALQRFERAAAAAIRAPLRSQKHIDKAVASIDEAAGAQTRVVELLGVLMTKFTEAGTRSQTTGEALDTRATEIAARSQQLAALLRRFDALGLAAHEINDAVRAIDPKDVRTQLEAVEQKMTSIVAEAEALHRDAQAADLTDLVQQADGLRQQILSARNKVSLAATKLRAV